MGKGGLCRVMLAKSIIGLNWPEQGFRAACEPTRFMSTAFCHTAVLSNKGSVMIYLLVTS